MSWSIKKANQRVVGEGCGWYPGMEKGGRGGDSEVEGEEEQGTLGWIKGCVFKSGWEEVGVQGWRKEGMGFQ